MKNTTINKNLKWALLATSICVGYLIISTFYNMRQTQVETTIIQTALNRLLQLENIIKNTRALESGQRGFIISGDDLFLRTYQKGLDRVKVDTTLLKSLPVTGKERETQQRLLKEIHAKIVHSEKTVDEFHLRGSDAAKAIIATRQGVRTMNEIESLVFLLETKERNTLSQANLKRQEFAEASSQRLYLIAFVFLFLLGISYLMTRRFVRTMVESGQKLKYNASLIQNISDPIITTDSSGLVSNWNSYAELLWI